MSEEEEHLSGMLEIFEAIGLGAVITLVVGIWSFIKRITINTELIRELIEKTDVHDKKLDAMAEKLSHTAATCRFHHPEDGR